VSAHETASAENTYCFRFHALFFDSGSANITLGRSFQDRFSRPAPVRSSKDPSCWAQVGYHWQLNHEC
jgi:hypothetical protein